MIKKIPVAVSWSGGKDSSLMLWHLLNNVRYEVIELHTAISSETDRVSMHGISKKLMQAQWDSIGIPLHFISIPADTSNKSYEKALSTYYTGLKDKGINHIGFGDIFLEDLKSYRDEILHHNKLEGIYPLWKKNTKELSNEFIDQGFKTIICCSNKSLFNDSICGKEFSHELLNSFPTGIDPCGENGEFHTFVFDGPIFKKKINLELREIITKSYYSKLDNGEESKSEFEFADFNLVN